MALVIGHARDHAQRQAVGGGWRRTREVVIDVARRCALGPGCGPDGGGTPTNRPPASSSLPPSPRRCSGEDTAVAGLAGPLKPALRGEPGWDLTDGDGTVGAPRRCSGDSSRRAGDHGGAVRALVSLFGHPDRIQRRLWHLLRRLVPGHSPLAVGSANRNAPADHRPAPLTRPRAALLALLLPARLAHS